MKTTENDITKEQIAEWKKEYGHIYRTYLEDQPIIWRRLRRKEYEEIMLATVKDGDAEDDTERDYTERVFLRQDMIARAAIIYPDEPTKLLDNYAFAATNLSEEIMAKSGFDMGQSEEL